ncbi:MAG TPA: nuclear transport factor 2 family protein [Terriglobales bacterium]|nr:nuclear transport factor 2 family protein [Terriglobales bacterium]
MAIEDDVARIQALGEEYFNATNLGDADRCLATMAPDVVIMPPDRPSIVGRDALQRLSRDYHAKFEPSYRLVYDEVLVTGDLAVARASVSGTRRSRSDGRVEKLNWRNLWVLKRQPDGKWKFWRIMFNNAVPSQTE